MGRPQAWQDEAWRFTRSVGELGYFVRWRSNACAQVRLVASEIDPNTGLPTGSVDPDSAEGQKFVELVKKIAGGPLGQKRLIKRAAACLTVPGELWICILQRPDGERWYAVAKKEITQSQKQVTLPDGKRGATVAIGLPDGTKHDFDPDADAMFRVWNEDLEDATRATSPIESCLDPLGEIERATKKIRNADRSRLLNNGLLMVPSEASLPDPQSPTGEGQPTSPAGTRRVAASLQRMIVQAAEASDRDENALVSVLPIVAAAPGEHLGKVVHIEFSKEATKTSVEIRNDGIARVATAIDMSPERLLGMGSNSNHWSAYLLADEDVKLHVNPVMEVLVQAIYESTLCNLLEAEGIDTAKYTLWFDASHLTKDPDLTDEAKDTYGHGIMRSQSFVQTMGLPDDSLYDLTSDEGWAEWARDRVSDDPARLPMLAQLIPELADKDFGATQPTDPDDDVDEQDDDLADEQPPIDPGTEEPDTEANDPTEPTYTVSAVEELMCNRALDLAAKRRIDTSNRALHARLRHVPAHERNRHLPPVTPDEVSRLVQGWDSILTPDYATAHGLNAGQLRTAVLARVTAELTADGSNAHVTNGLVS